MIVLDVNFTNYEYALIKKNNVCNGRLNDIDIDTKIVFEEYNYLKNVENIENYKHIVTQKFKSYDESSDRHLQGHFRLYVDDFASFSKVVDYPYYSHRTDVTTYLKTNNEQRVYLKDEAYCTHEMKFNDLEKTDFLAKPLELFNEKSIVRKYEDVMENSKEYDIVNMLIDEKVIDSKRYNELREEKKEQDFINAVNSVTNKEHDQGLEQ